MYIYTISNDNGYPCYYLVNFVKNFTNFRGLQWFWGGDSDIHLVFSHGDHSSYTQFFCSTFKRALVSEVDTER